MDPGNPGADSLSPPPFPPTIDAAGKQKEVEDRLGQLLERWKPLRDAASLHNSKWQRDADALAHQAAALLADVDDLQSVVASASDKEDIAHQSAQKVSHSLVSLPFQMREAGILWVRVFFFFFFSWLILCFCGLMKLIIRKSSNRGRIVLDSCMRIFKFFFPACLVPMVFLGLGLGF
jgi:hypothetical protein